MSERKAINKYYPPDWDPSKVVKKKKQTGNQTIKIRMMAPYSMRCTKCNEYIAERRSFNARKETTNEKYLNIKIIRFYITCPGCNNSITFKTNPQTAGYTPEEGAVRNYEPKKKVSSAKQGESEDELLKRLEREEEENKKFQLLKEKRKHNPFWTESEHLNKGDVLENLQKRLQEQQKQQQINNELEELQVKLDDVSAKGGVDKIADMAQKKIESDLQFQKQVEQDIEKQDEVIAKVAFENRIKRPLEKEEVPVVKRSTVPSKITLKKKKPISKPINNLNYSSSDED
ncbi:Protein CWC16 [Spathaspora sp. JA1]|nr:Protein CWC16 [Spathaspora sp. JA1]